MTSGSDRKGDDHYRWSAAGELEAMLGHMMGTLANVTDVTPKAPGR